jgi:hypothetical protein
MPDAKQVVEIYGEGVTDLGVLPVFVRQLCDHPASMEIRPKKYPVLQKKALWQKLRFVKRHAFYTKTCMALVFVVDTEGNHPNKLNELKKGRDSELLAHPTAVGVAHPCIESWLLADASAIKRAMKPQQEPALLEEPESLPAPCKNRDRNPKTVLACAAGLNRAVASAEARKIAEEIRDLELLRTRCPVSFEPFAREIEQIIKPLVQKH